MSFFSYTAITAEGLHTRGVIETDNLDTAQNELSAQGLNLLSMRETGKAQAALARGFAPWLVRRTEIIEFAKNLSVILRAGVPILNALEDIIQTVDNKHLKKALSSIRDQVGMGTSLSRALNSHKNIFPDVFIRLVAVGEETGRLELSIADVADHLQRMEDLRSMVKRAMMYPVFAVVTTGGALVFWMVYVLPKIMAVIKDMGIKLPFVTRGLIMVSEGVQTFWWAILILLAAGAIAFRLLKRKEDFRYLVDRVKMRLPIVKLFTANRLLTLFSEQLRILVVSGITIDRSLGIIAQAMGSELFKRALVKVRERVISGSRISDALRETKVFPPLVVRMVDIGETSGNLDEQFAFLSKFYFDKLEDLSDRLGKMIEPLLIVTVGLIFAVILIGLFLPIYDIVAKFDSR